MNNLRTEGIIEDCKIIPIEITNIGEYVIGCDGDSTNYYALKVYNLNYMLEIQRYSYRLGL